ncbi:MAG: divergent PAP2 family protein [Bacillaceae bacterium]
MNIFQNGPLMAAVIAWFLAQLSKVIIHLFKTRDLDFSLFFASGGMPSSHSSTVSALAVAIGLQEGFDSSYFAIALIFAIVVMYDAKGVRYAVSKHAKLLNDFFHGKLPKYQSLNELIGHTTFEVIIGALLGIVVALLV